MHTLQNVKKGIGEQNPGNTKAGKAKIKLEACQGQNFEALENFLAPQIPNVTQCMPQRQAPDELD